MPTVRYSQQQVTGVLKLCSPRTVCMPGLQNLKSFQSCSEYVGHDSSCSLHAHCMSTWDGKCLASAKLPPDAKIPSYVFLADSGGETKNGKK